MLLQLYKAERMKLRRSPVWLVFIVVPAVPAFLGTMNYLNNIEILTSEWYSLWTQHTLFTSYFFLPICYLCGRQTSPDEAGAGNCCRSARP